MMGLIVLFIFIIGAGSLLYKIFLFPRSQEVPVSTGENSTGLVKTISGDFDRDEKVTIEDVNLVKANVGCKKSDPCWSKVVGHTKEGDNIMYTSDLDMNADSIIDEKDIPVLPQ